MTDLHFYNLSDIKDDVDYLVQDWVDVFDSWTQSLSIPNNSLPQIDNALLGSINNHIKNVRYINFAVAALSAELDHSLNLSDSVNDVNENINSSSIELSVYPVSLAQFLSSLPMSLPISDIIKTDSRAQSLVDVDLSLRDSSIKQLQRDIERDRLVINGVRLVGADGGLDRVISTIGDTIDQLLLECCLPALSRLNRDKLSILILKQVSRTNSGGTTFQCLQTLLDVTETVLIPVSTLAKPLRIHLSIDRFDNVLSPKSPSQSDMQGTATSVESVCGTTCM